MKTRIPLVAFTALMFCILAGFAHGDTVRHPRPSGYAEPGTSGAPAAVTFGAVREDARFTVDLTATFPRQDVMPATVKGVTVNGKAHETFLVKNANIFNGNREVHAGEDLSISVYEGWQPGQEYTVEVTLAAADGKEVKLAAAGTTPAERSATGGLGFGTPTADYPYHHVTLTLAKEAIGAGTVVKVETDGKWNRDARFYNEGVADPATAKDSPGLLGETYTGVIDGSKDFRIVAPVQWLNVSDHTMKVTVKGADEVETVYEGAGKAPEKGGYWSAAWPHAISLIVHETAGLQRIGEPVHAMVGPYADDFGPADSQIRVVTYDPTHPKAGADGYVVAPHQVTEATEWRDEAMLTHEEKDPETGALIHRYDPTTTVELVFLADVQQYEKKVYFVVYGNTAGDPAEVESDLKVEQHERLSQTVSNGNFSIFTSPNSGSVETVTILGEGEPVLLEHKLETNGAVHWNPDIYTPPTPWVHTSDWEAPDYAEKTGPIMHRTRRHGLQPMVDNASAHVSYTFYAGQPYILQTSLMEILEDVFVSAMRNGEMVFNKAILNEFVWQDELGVVKHMPIEGSKLHPIHALDIPADTPWMAFINREKKIGFANIALSYENTNRYGDPASVGQPYFYVQNGPWVYWARPLVYPFAGNNMTRLMKVRNGSTYYEENAWVPFRFAEGDNPFAEIEKLNKKLRSPLHLMEWMPTNERAPLSWIMPILTMPFDEGVAGAVSGHKEVKEEGKE
jgi:hypothetical protein